MQLVDLAVGDLDLFARVFNIALLVHLACQPSEVELLRKSIQFLFQVGNAVNPPRKLRYRFFASLYSVLQV